MKKTLLLFLVISCAAISSCKKDKEESIIEPNINPIDKLVGIYSSTTTTTTHRVIYRNGQVDLDTIIVEVAKSKDLEVTKVSDSSFLINQIILFSIPPLKVFPGYLFDSSNLNRVVSTLHMYYDNPHIRQLYSYESFHEEESFSQTDTITTVQEAYPKK